MSFGPSFLLRLSESRALDSSDQLAAVIDARLCIRMLDKRLIVGPPISSPLPVRLNFAFACSNVPRTRPARQ
jgi:hypothetical protein